MSKVAKNQSRPSRKVTDFFQRNSSLSSIPSSPLSAPSTSQNPSTTTRSTKAPAAGLKNSQPQKKQPEASSSSSDSPALLTPDSRARASTSLSHSDAVIVVSDPEDTMPKRKASSSKVKVEDAAPSKKKGFRPRTVVPSAAKTTVRRRNLDPPITRSSGPSVLQLARTRASLKRKHDSDHEDNSLFPDEPPASKTRSTTSLSRLSTLTSSSAPLTPRKSNIPSPVEKARRNGHASPPKKARRNSPVRKTPLSRQATAEIVPSSQSDEEELNITKVPDVNPVEVMQSVDKWRRDSSVVATQGSSVVPPQDEVPLPEPDFMDTVLDTIPMDVDGELLYADPIPSSDLDIEPSPMDDVVPSLPSSEDEVKSHLEAVELSSPLDSPKAALRFTPKRPTKATDTPKVAVDQDISMEDAFRIRTPSPVPDFLMALTKTPVPRTQQTRTQQILADIHARAMQISYDSDEDRPLELKDILDSNSSDDDDLEDDIFKKLNSDKKDKGKEKMLVLGLLSSFVKMIYFFHV